LTVSDYGIRQMLQYPIPDKSRLLLADELRRTGLYLRDQVRETGFASPEVLALLRDLHDTIGHPVI